MPTSAEEVWRYSLIDDLDLDEFAVPEPVVDTARPPATIAGVGEWEAPDGPAVAALVVTVDDRVVTIDVHESALEAGLTVTDLSAADAARPEPGFEPATGLFGTLNEAFTVSPLLIGVPRSAEVPGTVHVVRLSTREGASSFPRLLLRADANSSVRLVEHHRSSDVTTMVVPRTEVVVGDDARVRYLAVNDLGRSTWQLAAFVANVGRNGRLTSAAAAFGGFYTRLRTDCRLAGRGAEAELLAAYFGDGDQTLDFRTFQDHHAPDTTSDLLFKGAVDDRSRSVYTGLIKVRPEGRNTNAYQTNHNIKLSDEAWAESVPNLEIETNDVRCSHASTVGPIDEEQRFYLESRGVRPDDAERLVLTGFFEEVFSRIDIPGAAEPLRHRVATKVGARLAGGVPA